MTCRLRLLLLLRLRHLRPRRLQRSTTRTSWIKSSLCEFILPGLLSLPRAGAFRRAALLRIPPELRLLWTARRQVPRLFRPPLLVCVGVRAERLRRPGGRPPAHKGPPHLFSGSEPCRGFAQPSWLGFKLAFPRFPRFTRSWAAPSIVGSMGRWNEYFTRRYRVRIALVRP